MRIIKSIIVAFSMYSRIPMPQFAWKDEDMKYMLCFFPWVGAVIGFCLFLWGVVSGKLLIGQTAYILIATAIPLLITGGFHVDGFMDTMDAFHSYQPKERKLEIMKDSHIGAFSVISLALLGMLWLAAISEINRAGAFGVMCAGFMLSRVLSGISVVTFPSAKKEGLLYLFADKAQRDKVKLALYAQGILCAGFMLFCSLKGGILAIAAALAVLWYYYRKTKKELGGITGDTAGYFVVICETAILAAEAVVSIL